MMKMKKKVKTTLTVENTINENWIKMKTLSKKKNKVFNIKCAHKRRKSISRFHIGSVSFSQWHYTIALSALAMKETRPPPAAQSSTCQGSYGEAVLAKPHGEKFPCTLWRRYDSWHSRTELFISAQKVFQRTMPTIWGREGKNGAGGSEGSFGNWRWGRKEPSYK